MAFISSKLILKLAQIFSISFYSIPDKHQAAYRQLEKNGVKPAILAVNKCVVKINGM
jgi:hypothetical protein